MAKADIGSVNDRLLLLATHYHRDGLDDPAGDVLGEAQWKWLAAELAKPAELMLIGSSIQLVAEEHGNEKWANFPVAQERSYRALSKRARTQALIVLSGDRHTWPSFGATIPHGRPAIVDITSSSLTRPLGEGAEDTNRFRRGQVCFRANLGLLAIDWHAGLASIKIRGVDGGIGLEHTIPLQPVVAKARRAIEVEGLQP